MAAGRQRAICPAPHLAHLSIRQLAFTPDTPRALTERIYARQPTDEVAGTAGSSIYTAAGDQKVPWEVCGAGRAAAAASHGARAIDASRPAFPHPIRRESAGQGVSALNLAACHACTLIAETSCGYSNALRPGAGGRESGTGRLYETHFNSVMGLAKAETLA